ncbi:hypothetical protein [Shewanella glacialipiscicola]|uniref:hypothetical protein n=1 Tax=Shewanella glacialipiscicola TaxID=614069 RepID=UPI003D7B07A8
MMEFPASASGAVSDATYDEQVAGSEMINNLKQWLNRLTGIQQIGVIAASIGLLIFGLFNLGQFIGSRVVTMGWL